jgi:hypothetical protein
MCIVVHVDNAKLCTGGYAGLHKLIVNLERTVRESTVKHPVNKILPSYWESKSIHSIVCYKMVHLAGAIGTILAWKGRYCLALAIIITGIAAKIESSDVYTGI